MVRIQSFAAWCAAACWALAAAGADGTGTVAGDKQTLAPLQSLVGEWKGVGQPKRGSNQGAWTEELEWAWKFSDGHAELVAQLTRDKYFAELRLQATEKPGRFVLLATDADNASGNPPQRFIGARGDDGLVLVAADAPADRPARISLRMVADGDRLVILYERRAGDEAFARLAEVGATRRGSGFAKAALGGPECVVTGGLGKIAVQYKGKTYYVCCGGCRDLFNDDPEGVLSDYRERKAAEAREKNP